jgi:glycosyltransferase involved in cell wall biosynthesis
MALRRAIRDIEPDLVISFLTKINAIALAATLFLKIPVIVSERNNPLMQPAHWLWRVTLWLLYSRARAIICQTRASVVCIPKYCRSRIRIIANPVWPIDRRPVRHGEPMRIAAVGRLERQKGFDVLISAFADVATEFPDCGLHLWGQGPLRDELADQARQLAIENRVQFRGVSSTPGAWIEEVDIFVLSSRFEGFPNVLAEAMAAGLPVVATRCDFGPPDLVREGESGLLVHPESAPALANAIKKLLADTGLRQKLSEAAPEVAEKFAPWRIEAQWKSVIAEVLGLGAGLQGSSAS